jgi:hypothetical protein
MRNRKEASCISKRWSRLLITTANYDLDSRPRQLRKSGPNNQELGSGFKERLSRHTVTAKTMDEPAKGCVSGGSISGHSPRTRGTRQYETAAAEWRPSIKGETSTPFAKNSRPRKPSTPHCPLISSPHLNPVVRPAVPTTSARTSHFGTSFHISFAKHLFYNIRSWNDLPVTRQPTESSRPIGKCPILINICPKIRW